MVTDVVHGFCQVGHRLCIEMRGPRFVLRERCSEFFDPLLDAPVVVRRCHAQQLRTGVDEVTEKLLDASRPCTSTRRSGTPWAIIGLRLRVSGSYRGSRQPKQALKREMYMRMSLPRSNRTGQSWCARP